MAEQLFYYNPEELGRRRFPDNKQARSSLQGRADIILSSMQDLVASNYPKTENSNFAILYRTLAREYARLQQSINSINDDKIYTQTRIEFLQQILGERLFLNKRIAPLNYTDESYRQYLIAIKDAYLKGSTVENIENIIGQFTNQNVRLKELYKEARKPNSAYGVVDTHKMVLQIFVDDLISAGKDLATISSEINFFVNLTRPAHVLYDTKYIWTEIIDINKTHDLIFGDTGGGCVPLYLFNSFQEPVVLALQILRVAPPTIDLLLPSIVAGSTEGTHRIDSIHMDSLLIFLENGTRVIVEPGLNGTKIFDISGKRMVFEELNIGDYIQLTSIVVPGDFEFYWTPPDLIDNYDSRFYKDVYRKPAFQEFVKKIMDAQGRFPAQIRTTETTLCDRWVQDLLQPMYEDLRRDCSDSPEKKKNYTITLKEKMWSPRFSWENNQGESLGRERSGDIYSFTTPYAPLTDGSGNPANPSDITVFKDSTALINSVYSVDASNGFVSLFNTVDYWDTTGNGVPIIGQFITLDYSYSAGITDSTASTSYVFGISQWQLPKVPISNGEGTDVLALPSDVLLSVDGTSIPNAVVDLNSILGHVTINPFKDFWETSPLGRVPAVGDTFDFEYYQSGTKKYSMLWDDISRTLDDDMVFDGADGSLLDPIRTPIPKNSPLEIGYKFRADLLHHASVLNSPDTLLLNNYQKPSKRASIINRQDTLNHYNYFFSPEHLTDTDPDIILNDDYLNKDIPSAITLNAGTPPFQKTYSHHPDLVYHKKLKDVRKNHRLLMYSDLLLKQYESGDNTINLSSICDSDQYSFKIRFREELNKLKECESWVLFDTVTMNPEEVSIPSSVHGVANLRVRTKRLRENIILREVTSVGYTNTTYDVYVPLSTPQSVFQLPETIRYTVNDVVVDFPSLPVMKNDVDLATIADVTVFIDGVNTPGLISYLDPITGYIEFYTPVNGVIVTFVYNILSTETMGVLDSNLSRIMDWDQVFPAECFNGFEEHLTVQFNEYINFLSDYSAGIKFTYYNRLNQQIEEHVFSGPVFELANPYEDQLSSPDEFPDALVRIKNFGNTNPLLLPSYDYMNGEIVRIRKKTIKELLPDRTFKTTELLEALPI